MIIDSHVHISLYDGNTNSLQGAFDLLQTEMRANGVGAAIIIPDNIENSDNIADLDKAIELIGDRKNFFSWAARRSLSAVQAKWKSTASYWNRVA